MRLFAETGATFIFSARRRRNVTTAFERSEHLDACIVIRNADAISQAYTAAKGAFTVPLRQMSYGTEFYVRNPDGYILGFVQPASE